MSFPLYLFSPDFLENPEIVVGNSVELPPVYRRSPYNNNFSPKDPESLFRYIVANRIIPTSKGGNQKNPSSNFRENLISGNEKYVDFYEKYIEPILDRNNIVSSIDDIKYEKPIKQKGKVNHIDLKKNYVKQSDPIYKDFNKIVIPILPENEIETDNLTSGREIEGILEGMSDFFKRLGIKEKDIKDSSIKAQRILKSEKSEIDGLDPDRSHQMVKVKIKNMFPNLYDDGGDISFYTMVSPSWDDLLGMTFNSFDPDPEIDMGKAFVKQPAIVEMLKDENLRQSLTQELDQNNEQILQVFLELAKKEGLDIEVTPAEGTALEDFNNSTSTANGALASSNSLRTDPSLIGNRYKKSRAIDRASGLDGYPGPFLKYLINKKGGVDSKRPVKPSVENEKVIIPKKYFDNRLSEDPDYEKYLDAIAQETDLDSIGAREAIEAYMRRSINQDNFYYIDDFIFDALTEPGEERLSDLDRIFQTDELGTISKKPYSYIDDLGSDGFTYEHITPIKSLARMINFSKELRGEDLEGHKKDIQKILDKFYRISYTNRFDDSSINKILQSELPTSVYDSMGVEISQKGKNESGNNISSFKSKEPGMTADDFIKKVEALPNDIALKRYKDKVNLVKRSELFSKFEGDNIETPHKVGDLSTYVTQKDSNRNFKKFQAKESKTPKLTSLIFGYYG